MRIFRNTVIIGAIGVKAVCNVVSGTLNTAKDALALTNSLVKGDFNQAGEIATRKVKSACNGIEQSILAAGQVLEQCADCIEDRKKPFLDAKTSQSLATLATAFIVADAVGAVGVATLGDDVGGDAIDSDNGLLPKGSTDSFTENGVFTGDNSDLEELKQLGEVSDTDHIDSDDIQRDLSARNEFLAQHGFNSVPEGYEVHHIVPLSEGGADTPENMILVKEDLHDEITATHSKFYDWRKS